MKIFIYDVVVDDGASAGGTSDATDGRADEPAAAARASNTVYETADVASSWQRGHMPVVDEQLLLAFARARQRKSIPRRFQHDPPTAIYCFAFISLQGVTLGYVARQLLTP